MTVEEYDARIKALEIVIKEYREDRDDYLRHITMNIDNASWDSFVARYLWNARVVGEVESEIKRLRSERVHVELYGETKDDGGEK